MHIDQKLYEFATPRQSEILDAIALHGGKKQAARALGVSRATVQCAFRAVVHRAATMGYSPAHDMSRTVPEGYAVKGVSTYYNKEGKPTGQWVKSSADENARLAAIMVAIEGAADALPRLEAVPLSGQPNADLINLYTLTDCHVGMLAWHKEGGDDWDLTIAENTLVSCFDAMIAASPAADKAVVCQLGDFMHFDGLIAQTPTSGHPLDADGRFGKIVEVAIRVLRRIVDMALSKHAEVELIIAEGNHDIVSSIWLRKLFGALYENEPRLKINDSELPYYCIQHGETMLFFHHGHLTKRDNLANKAPAIFPKIWGNTTKRYAHCGHYHHEVVRESDGMTITQHPTLAARDAYTSRRAWFGERAAKSITYSARFGKVAENVICPEMVGV